MLEIEFAQLSDPGLVRGHNEDFLGHVAPDTMSWLAAQGLACTRPRWR